MIKGAYKGILLETVRIPICVRVQGFKFGESVEPKP